MSIRSSHARLLRLADVRERTGLSSSSLYNRLNSKSPYYDPTFPRQIRLGSVRLDGRGAVAWDSDEIDVWVETRKQTRAASA